MKNLFLAFFVCWANVVYFVEVSRHGARAPITFMPWDNKDRWPNGEKNLLDEGMRQHYILGQYLRSRYIEQSHLLQNTYNSSEIKVYSTNISRTYYSMQSQLLGLYPQEDFSYIVATVPISIESPNIEARGPQIPIFTDTKIIEPMLLSEDYCIKFKNHVEEQKLSIEYAQLFKKHQISLGAVANYFNTTKERAVGQFLNVLGSATSNQFMGYSIPYEFDEKWIEKSQKLYIEMRTLLRYSNEYVQKFAASQFFNELISQFEAKIYKETELKATLYSAHDTTIMNIFATLNIPLEVQPPYASIILFELYEFGNGFRVKLMYNNSPVNLPACESEYCDFSVFKEYVHSRTFRNVTSACENMPRFKKYIDKLFMQEKKVESSSSAVTDDLDGHSLMLFINFSLMIIVIISLYYIIKKIPR